MTYICCGLMVGLTLAFALLALMVGGFIAEYLDRADAAGLALMLAGSVIASLAMSVAACWFAWKSTQRKAWARIALAVCAGVALAFAILAAGPHSLVAVPGSTAVLVLLFLPPSNDWFRTTG